MITTKKTENLAPFGGPDMANVSLKVLPDRSAFCAWSVHNKLFFSKFRDFNWEFTVGSPVVVTESGDISMDEHCFDVDDEHDVHMMYRVALELKYIRTSKEVWSSPTIVARGDVKSFCSFFEPSYLHAPLLGYILGVSDGEDVLTLKTVDGSVSQSVTITGNDNKLLRMKRVQDKLYILWVEKENYPHVYSSSSQSVTVSGVNSNSTSSVLEAADVSSSSDVSEVTLSASSSSSTEAVLQSKVSYLVYDIPSDTFDFTEPISIDFTLATGDILSFDFVSVLDDSSSSSSLT